MNPDLFFSFFPTTRDKESPTTTTARTFTTLIFEETQPTKHDNASLCHHHPNTSAIPH